MKDDLTLTSKYWWSVDELAERYRLSVPSAHRLVQPHRGKCYIGRRGKHPRRVLWIPVEVVRVLDRERRSAAGAVKGNPPKH